MTTPFDFLKSINQSKEDIMVDDIEEKAYKPYFVNRSLSYFPDTVLLANEMNIHHHIDNRLQFDFLLNTVRSGKRYAKWAKAETPDHLEVVKEYYGYSDEKAKVALTLLSDKQVEELKQRVFKGGKRKL